MSDIREFQEYVKKGDLENVKRALAEKPELLNTKNESGQSSFLLAKYYRQPTMAEYLLSLDPQLDIFSKCVAGLTNEALVEIDREPTLLQAHNSDGWTPLHLAAFFGHPDLAKGLLNHGAEVDARSTNAMQNTPLHAAAAGGNAALIEVLLAAGADVNATQHGGWTALHSAAQTGNLEMADILLAHGANAQVRAENNQSPLDLALMQGKGEMAEFLEARQ
ncbi:MAG TPA: ankyrin repeat domain-containing protein [Bryobacteraceae bacterium]|jgi:ankyrin repeat protein|nr:ankyrin repeat domain-containing protein [Bryobacteraceae bacterium]